MELSRSIPGADIEIYGNGFIGDKAGQLVEKTAVLREIGFRTPRRVILAEDCFDGYFQRNELGDNLRTTQLAPTLASRIRDGEFSPEDVATLQAIGTSFDTPALVIRSSAAGDARGTGIYTSVVVANDTTQTVEGVKQVLESYFSPSAIAFRKDAKTGEGFAIMIEPLIGQPIAASEYAASDNPTFSPILSGFGYTSTAKGEGYTNIVPGYGGGVDNREGLEVTGAVIKQYDGRLFDYILEKREISIQRGLDAYDIPSLLTFDMDGFSYAPYSASRKHFLGEMVHDPQVDLPNLNFSTFFEMMQEMETVFGKPQYLEWALTSFDGKPSYWLLQIADIDRKTDIFDFSGHGEPLFSAYAVTGSGIVNSEFMIDCFNPQGIPRLREFNQTHAGYVLLYADRLSSSLAGKDFGTISYEDFSNAAVLLAYGGSGLHSAGESIGHIGGLAAVTGKLFGVLNPLAEIKPNWEVFNDKEQEDVEMKTYRGDITTVASERQNKMIIYVQDQKKED